MDIEEVVRDIEEAVRLLDSETAMATEATRVVSARDAAAAVFREMQQIGRFRPLIGAFEVAAAPVPLAPPQLQMPVAPKMGAIEAGVPWTTLLQFSPPKMGGGAAGAASHVMDINKDTKNDTENAKKKDTKINSSKKAKKAKKGKWTLEETQCLEQGVALFGEGQWLKIKRHFPEQLKNRSNVDIKDRWRNFGGVRQSQKRRKSSPPPDLDSDGLVCFATCAPSAKRMKVAPVDVC